MAEAATLTVDTLLDMLTVMTDESRTDVPGLAEWARNNLGSFETKLAVRTALTASREGEAVGTSLEHLPGQTRTSRDDRLPAG